MGASVETVQGPTADNVLGRIGPPAPIVTLHPPPLDIARLRAGEDPEVVVTELLDAIEDEREKRREAEHAAEAALEDRESALEHHPFLEVLVDHVQRVHETAGHRSSPRWTLCHEDPCDGFVLLARRHGWDVSS